MKIVLVTGISGFLGAHIAQQLLEEGYWVKGLVRDKSKYKGVQHTNLELLEGDLFRDLINELKGVDCIVHAAAETRQNRIHYKEYNRTNYDATVLLFETAIFCKVKQFIFISTANTVGYGNEKAPGDETIPIKSPFNKSNYAKSKLAAENFLLSSNNNIKVSVLNPSFMIGPFCNKPSSSRIILLGWHKWIIFYPPGGKNFVHVSDVAQAVSKVIVQKINKQRILIANENLTYREFFNKLILQSQQHSLLVKIPSTLLLGFGLIGDLIRCLGIHTNLSYTNMRIISLCGYYSNKKSINELNLSYKSVDLAIQETLKKLSESKLNN